MKTMENTDTKPHVENSKDAGRGSPLPRLVRLLDCWQADLMFGFFNLGTATLIFLLGVETGRTLHFACSVAASFGAGLYLRMAFEKFSLPNA